jgi:hypothetical protein
MSTRVTRTITIGDEPSASSPAPSRQSSGDECEGCLAVLVLAAAIFFAGFAVKGCYFTQAPTPSSPAAVSDYP